ncbi:MAG TPA: bifunctional alpha,alpha-trehalose-phosphate synthase (UDP-forming)/trehalose-phosphatase [Puia sp.]|jgi:trehalose 6-phosphate synthase/phosphatase|nr:bifunctional alpha,alpha-trehalose-phosphate synthase (UDP-forming)/trehalose-phosphatase [Puia sp.]
MLKKRLFIVSNRLPITIEQKDNGFTSRPSSGGLVSAITGYLQKGGQETFSETFWAGVPGCTEKTWAIAMNSLSGSQYGYLPIFLNWKKYELYYNGFSNSVLWPLFHYFPSFVDYNSSYYEAWLEVNGVFAEKLGAQLRKDDVVWIHDYHLLPLAGLLRKRIPTLTIGFFLHIPFPSYELFRLIPKGWQRSILSGMLGADLIGFHTIDYASHFLSSVEEVLQIEHDGQLIWWENRQVKADAFPIGIDFEKYNHACDDPKVKEVRKQYLELKGTRKLIFSVDRLDYTKGVANRLKSYQHFITSFPEYKGNVIFVLVIVPSRDVIIKYAERKKIIDEAVGNINSSLGSVVWQPIIYKYGHLSFEELIALYTACDLALITPLRDGMNLVSKEFVASRKDGHGALVLSEMAGAARELTEALLVNPNDIGEMAVAIKTGLEMSEASQRDRLVEMQDRIRRYDVFVWAADFFRELTAVKKDQLEFEIKFLDAVTRIELLDAYARAARRILLLDYDGTLVPFAKFPGAAAPTPDVLEILSAISDNPLNEIYIVSGRDSHTLEKWFSGMSVGLIAEHGAKVRHKNGAWETAVNDPAEDWKSKMEKIMQGYVDKCPHTFIERKDYSIAWHYRNADLGDGAVRARELYDDLIGPANQMSLNVLNGHKVIEVRLKGINKGAAINRIVTSANYDFILCIGDDETDEDMFKKLAGRPDAFTIKVGNEASFAKYNLHNPAMVQALLQTVSSYAPGPPQG